MPLLKTHCNEQVKARFRALASTEGLSEALLLRRMVATILASETPGVSTFARYDTQAGRGGLRGQIKLRLWANEIQAIRSLATPEGYSAQAWIVRQLRQRLENAIPFAKDELVELRDAIRELSAVGRNLNTLVHVLLRSDRLVGELLDLPDLANKVETLRRTVTATMIRATHRGGGDVER